MKVLIDDLIVEGDHVVYRLDSGRHKHWTSRYGSRVRISGFEEWRIDPDVSIAESLGDFDSDDYRRKLDSGE
jgi:hypothetical protein